MQSAFRVGIWVLSSVKNFWIVHDSPMNRIPNRLFLKTVIMCLVEISWTKWL